MEIGLATRHPYDYALSADAVAWSEAPAAAKRTADQHDCLSGQVPICPRGYRTTQKKIFDRFVEDSLLKLMADQGVEKVWINSWAEMKEGRPDESTRISPAVLVRTSSGWRADKPAKDEKAHVGVALYDKRAQLKGTPDPSLAHLVTPSYHGSQTGYTKAESQEDYSREGR